MENVKYMFAHPYILRCFESELKPIKAEFERIKRAVAYRLIYVTEGECTLFLSGKSYHLEKNDIVYILPGDVYQTIPMGVMKVILVYFAFNQDDLLWYDTTAPDKNSSATRYNIEDCSLLNSAFVLKNIENKNTNFQKLLKEEDDEKNIKKQNIILETMMHEFVEHHNNGTLFNKGVSSNVKRVLEYINENLRERLSCTLIAEHFGYHPNYLNHIMRTELNKSLHKCIVEEKIKATTELLLEGKSSISEIALEFGFSDSSHFSKCYFNTTGILPSRLRKTVNEEIVRESDAII